MAFLQRPVLELVDIPQLVAHVHSNLLPRQIAEVRLLQNGLKFRIGHSFYYAGDGFLQVDKLSHIAADFILKVHNLCDYSEQFNGYQMRGLPF